MWGVLSQWFRVPKGPPSLPAGPADNVRSFRPSPGFLRYLKFQFWIGLILVDAGLAIFWFVLFANLPAAAIFLVPIAVITIVVPDIIAYLAIHLRYDTTWYVMTDR